MKSPLFIFGALAAILMTSCVRTTLENRRDLYEPQVVNGPYTRMLKEGIPSTQVTTVTTTTTTTQTVDTGYSK